MISASLHPKRQHIPFAAIFIFDPSKIEIKIAAIWAALNNRHYRKAPKTKTTKGKNLKEFNLSGLWHFCPHLRSCLLGLLGFEPGEIVRTAAGAESQPAEQIHPEGNGF